MYYSNPSVTDGMGLSPLSVTIRPVSSVTRGASEVEAEKTHPWMRNRKALFGEEARDQKNSVVVLDIPAVDSGPEPLGASWFGRKKTILLVVGQCLDTGWSRIR